MWLFEKRNIIVGTLLVASLTLNGCWKPSEKEDPHNGKRSEDASASFVLEGVKGGLLEPKDDETVWKIPTHKILSVRACLRDRVVNKDVRGHKFSIEIIEEKKRLTNLKTDVEGCLTWQEKINYNYFAGSSGYVQFTRRVHGAGVHVGFRDITLFVNPWAKERGDGGGVVWRRDGQKAEIDEAQILKDQMALTGKSDSRKAQLWVSAIRPHITYLDERTQGVKGGVTLEALYEMKPKIKAFNSRGQEIFIDLQAGQFNIWTQLIAANTGDARNQHLILTPENFSGFGKIIDTTLHASARVTMSHQVPRGRLEMALKIVPIGAPPELQPFESVYILGDVDRIVGSQNAFLKPEIYAEKNFDFANYLKSAANFEELKAKFAARDLEPFIFETANVMFAGIEPGETATERTVEYQLTTRVRDALTGAVVANQKFIVYDDMGKELKRKDRDGKEVPTITTPQGDLIWTSNLKHKYYLPEEYFFPSFKIAHSHSNFSKVKELVVNPWDAQFRTFGWDRQQFTEEYIAKVKNRKKIESRFFLPRFSYHTIRFLYKIDQFMNLEVRKLILLNLRPEVLRYSGIIGGRKVTEPLRDGLYLMKIAIQKDYLDPAQKGLAIKSEKDEKGQLRMVMDRGTGKKIRSRNYVSVMKRIVRVNAGEINTTAELSMRDLRLMRVRSNFIVQLETIDERMLFTANEMMKEWRGKVAEINKKRLADGKKTFSEGELKELAKEARAKTTEKVVAIKKRLGSLDVLKDKTEDPKTIADLKDFDLSEELKKNIADTLQTADFTVADTSPQNIEFDPMLEKDSGLEKRAFIGPIIFLNNSYSDDLRPIDNLDEKNCQTDDCNEFEFLEDLLRRDYKESLDKNTNVYATSKYFGSVKHFSNKQIDLDKLVTRFLRNKEEYKRMMPVISSMYYYTNLYNLSFVSLGNEKLRKFNENCESDQIDRCIVSTDERSFSVSNILGVLNANQAVFNMRDEIDVQRPFTPYRTGPAMNVNDLRQMIDTGRLSAVNKERFCRLFAQRVTNDLIAAYRKEDSAASVVTIKYTMRYTHQRLFQACASGIKDSEAADSSVSIRQILRIYDTGGKGDYLFKGGKQMNLNVGTNFGVSQSESFSTGFGLNMAEFPTIGNLMKPSWGRMWDVVDDVLKPVSIRVGRDWSRSAANGTSVSESTYLVMQAANFDVKIHEYERCAVIKFHPNLLARIPMPTLGQGSALAGEILKAHHSGLVICSGERKKETISINESYYYFTQHFTEGDMLDQADLYNHPWLLSLRGVRDFSAFVRMISDQKKDLYSPLQPVVDRPAWPLDQMAETYRRVLPSFPGIYNVLKEGEALKDFPFDSKPTTDFTEVVPADDEGPE